MPLIRNSAVNKDDSMPSARYDVVSVRYDVGMMWGLDKRGSRNLSVQIARSGTPGTARDHVNAVAFEPGARFSFITMFQVSKCDVPQPPLRSRVLL